MVRNGYLRGARWALTRDDLVSRAAVKEWRERYSLAILQLKDHVVGIGSAHAKAGRNRNSRNHTRQIDRLTSKIASKFDIDQFQRIERQIEISQQRQRIAAHVIETRTRDMSTLAEGPRRHSGNMEGHLDGFDPVSFAPPAFHKLGIERGIAVHGPFDQNRASQ